MKKIAFVSGLLLLTFTVLPFVSASRLKYHQYLYQQAQQGNDRSLERRTSPGGETFEIKRNRYSAPNSYYMRGHQNTGYDRYNTRNNYSKQRQYYGDYNQRHMSDRIRYTQSTPQISQRVYSPYISMEEDAVEQYVDYTNFRNDDFAIKMPSGWFVVSEDPYNFLNPNTSFEVTVKKFQPKVCEGSYHFDFCAANISKGENYAAIKGDGELEVISSLVRNKQWKNTFKNQRAQTETVMESFVGRDFGGKKIYVARYFIAGLDGKIYMVETKMDYEESPWFIGVSKTIFDSFEIL